MFAVSPECKTLHPLKWQGILPWASRRQMCGWRNISNRLSNWYENSLFTQFVNRAGFCLTASFQPTRARRGGQDAFWALIWD